jgi:RND superfamily putative drug exporter
MELLGKANWWLPGWLDRRLPAARAGSPGGDEPAPGTPTDDRAVAR